MSSAWEELRAVQSNCLNLCKEVASGIEKEVLQVPTEHFTACGDFKSKATVSTSHCLIYSSLVFNAHMV